MVRKFGGPANLSADNVFSGAASPRDLGRETRASEALAATLEKGTLTYVALGPLTNLAAFLELYPKLASRIERVILLGGQPPGSTLAFGPKRSFQIHDANVFKDPAAVTAVLRSKIPVVLVPVETASQLLIDRQDIRRLESGGPAGSYLARRSRIWFWFWTRFVKNDGGPIFDAGAILPVTHGGWLTMEERYAALDKSGNLIVTRRRTRGARAVRSCAKLAPGAKDFVLGRIVMRQSRE
jgi:inosine-uridine nucleoside N-ribohydrolase